MLRHRELAVATQAVYITAPGRGREKTNKKTTRAINISHSLPVFYEVPAFDASSLQVYDLKTKCLMIAGAIKKANMLLYII